MTIKESGLQEVLESWDYYKIIPEELGRSTLQEVFDAVRHGDEYDPSMVSALQKLCS